MSGNLRKINFNNYFLHYQMKKSELEILSHLRKDARTSLASISHDVNIPISTIYDKINRFHLNKIIERYTAILNFSKLGYHHRS